MITNRKWKILVGALIALAALSAYKVTVPTPDSSGNDPATNPPPGGLEEAVSAMPREEEFTDPLTGLVATELCSPIAVVIDNLAPARPQTGLDAAGLVYEVEVEGGVTRYLAFYASDPPPLVGPVRSARPYLALLAREWQVCLVHVGGSAAAYEIMQSWKLPRLDAMTTSAGFAPDKSRRAPHNTYLRPREAGGGNAATARFPPRDFREPPGDVEPEYQEIELDYGPHYRVTYQYDRAAGGYLRFINGEPSRDRATGQQLTTVNIIVQYAPHRNLGDKAGHLEIELLGRGRAEYFLGPFYTAGEWQKSGPDAPTVFLDAEGEPIKPVRGNTWIQIFRKDRDIKKSAVLRRPDN